MDIAAGLALPQIPAPGATAGAGAQPGTFLALVGAARTEAVAPPETMGPSDGTDDAPDDGIETSKHSVPEAPASAPLPILALFAPPLPTPPPEAVASVAVAPSPAPPPASEPAAAAPLPAGALAVARPETDRAEPAGERSDGDDRAASPSLPAALRPESESAEKPATRPATGGRESDGGGSLRGGDDLNARIFSPQPSAQSPFRLEVQALLPQGAIAPPPDMQPYPATAHPAVAAGPKPAEIPPDEGRPAAVPAADVSIGFDSEARIDVVLAAHDRRTAEKPASETPHLRRELLSLGTEVEAIRVELRGGGGTDAGARPDSQTMRDGFTGGQQGHARNGSHPGSGHAPATRFRLVAAPGGTEAGQIEQLSGKVDRYA